MKNQSGMKNIQNIARGRAQDFGFDGAHDGSQAEVEIVDITILNYLEKNREPEDRSSLPIITLDGRINKTGKVYDYYKNRTKGRMELMERSLDHYVEFKTHKKYFYHLSFYFLPLETTVTESGNKAILKRPTL